MLLLREEVFGLALHGDVELDVGRQRGVGTVLIDQSG